MKGVVIAGSRHRGWQPERSYRTQEPSRQDREFVEQIVGKLLKQDDLLVVSIGCDIGFGRMVQAVCEDSRVAFAEVRISASKRVPRPQYELLHLARHGALLDLAEEFYVFIADSRVSNIEDLVQRLQALPPGGHTHYWVYDESLNVIDKRE